MVKDLSLNLVKLYEGRFIKDLDACGLKLDPHCLGLEPCLQLLETL
jgi:hypothetical protein